MSKAYVTISDRRRSRCLRAATAALALGYILVPSRGHAQATPAPLPGSVEPGRLQERLQPAPTPPVGAPIVVPEAPENVPPEQAAQTHFELHRIVVDDSTVYTQEQLRLLYAPLLEKTVSLADIYRVADAVTTKYRSDGYILSRAVVTAQRIVDGEVHIRAVEGFVDKVTVQGSSNAAIVRYANIAKRFRPLRARDLERCLLLINDIPGVVAKGVLSPAAAVTGGSDLTILVTLKRTDAYVSLDNRGTKYIGPWQLFAQAGVNDVAGQGDRLGVRYITAPADERELRYFEFDYAVPIGGNGLTLSLQGSWDRSLPGSSLQTDTLRTEADGQTVEARLNYPILRSRTENLSVDASLAMRNSSIAQIFRPDGTRLVTSYDDRIREASLGMTYDRLDGWKGRDIVRLELTQGLPVFDASPDNRLTGTSRPGGQSTFTKGTVEASRLQSLDAITPGLDLLLALNGGWSFGQGLLATEQFGVGGPVFGRGYDPSEITGDYGVAGKFELQYSFRPTLGAMPKLAQLVGASRIPFFQLYAFVDSGAVWDQNPALLNEPDGARSITSTGLGVRANWHDRLLANIELTKALTRPVAAFFDQPNTRPFRLYFSVVGKF